MMAITTVVPMAALATTSVFLAAMLSMSLTAIATRRVESGHGTRSLTPIRLSPTAVGSLSLMRLPSFSVTRKLVADPTLTAVAGATGCVSQRETHPPSATARTNEPHLTQGIVVAAAFLLLDAALGHRTDMLGLPGEQHSPPKGVTSI
jgi:hypothetical protein